MTKSSYTVVLFRNLNGKIGMRHPKGQISYRWFRSWAEAKRFCRADGLKFIVED